ncbi:hypothetical protein SOCE26_052240 [Sorangium cellulosum]|uniref:Spermidine synthase n=1 Tax=Sorangium cellulosum TaxID=56 RepID=A0A2L0EWZ3_SORCE|nr:hypothetical protein [Sorangium cellulosum]AUX43769.1 hypothetical protein SOCE26_052240 [Sorangium cellulosum]
MRVSQRSGLFSGIAALACATVLLEITLARIYAALLGEPYALLAVTLSLVGAGASGVLLYLAPSLARPPALLARMAAFSALASGATLAAIIVVAQRGPSSGTEPASLASLALVYAASTAPFALSGLALAAAIRHAALEAPRLYLLDLAGGALGGLAAAAALRAAGAPRAALAAAIVFAAAGVLFSLGSRGGGGADQRRAPGGLVATFALGSCVLLAGDLGEPWLKLTGFRRTPLERVELEAWSERGLITVDRPRSGTTWLRRDGVAASPILEAKTAPQPQPEELGYALQRGEGPALVLGAGGGRDVRAALKAGHKEVYAVEADPGVVDVMRGRYAEFSGRLFDKPEVHVIVADPRSFVRRTPLLFRNIVVPSADTVAASTAGALALSESRLHTLEGVGDLLARLAPEGTLVMARPEGDFDRLLSLAAAALRRAGVAEPKDHLFGCSAARFASLLVKRAPLAQGEIDALRRQCRKGKFAELFAPDRPSTPLRARLVAAADARAAAPDAAADLTPPTDERPFFAYDVPARRLPAVLGDLKALRAEHTGLFALLALLAVGSGLLALAVLAPLLAGRAVRRLRPGGAAADESAAASAAPPPPPPPRACPLFFFAAIGAGFAFLELAVVRHVVLLLDVPAHELLAALVILLVSAGVGGLLTARVSPRAADGAASTAALLLAAAAALAAAGLVPLVQWSYGIGSFARAVLAVALLLPIGLLAGSLAPLGVKLVASISPALLPWCWGLCALAGAVATALGVLCAMHLGYSVQLLAAGVAYLLAAAAVPPPAAAGAAALGHDEGPPERASAAAAGPPPGAPAAGAQPEVPEVAPTA